MMTIAFGSFCILIAYIIYRSVIEDDYENPESKKFDPNDT